MADLILVEHRHDPVAQSLRFVVWLDPDKTIDDGSGNQVPDPSWLRDWTYGLPDPSAPYERGADGLLTDQGWADYDAACLTEVKGLAQLAHDQAVAAEAQTVAAADPAGSAVVLSGEGQPL